MDLTSSTLHIQDREGVVYLTFPSFERTGKVHHCFSTRLGGCSEGDYAQMNLSFYRGDDPQAVVQNFAKIGFVTGIYMGDTVFSDQVHGDRILYVDQQYRGSGFLRPVQIEGVDGLLTDKRRVALVTFHADCVPLFFLDPVRDAIGLAHAGWKGTLLKIGASMVRRMKEDFNSDPADILVGIGPSIGPCCFETGPDVYEDFQKVFAEEASQIVKPAANPDQHENPDNYRDSDKQGNAVQRADSDKRSVDLWKANETALLAEGVLPQHITVTDLCTKCHPDVFFSHRLMGEARGSMAAFLELY